MSAIECTLLLLATSATLLRCLTTGVSGTGDYYRLAPALRPFISMVPQAMAIGVLIATTAILPSCSGTASREASRTTHGGFATYEYDGHGDGDNENDRRTYTQEEIMAGAAQGAIVMNSLSDADSDAIPNGNETDFVSARHQNAECAWHAGALDVIPNEEYVIRLFYHNDSPGGEDALATGVTARFDIPVNAGTSQVIRGTIMANNTLPANCHDCVELRCTEPIAVEYVSGSAVLHNADNEGAGRALPDEITSNAGTLIGHWALDGVVPGGNLYAGTVTILVRTRGV